jgi:hypothetical protein
LSPSKGFLRPDRSRVLEVMKVGARVWSYERAKASSDGENETSRVRLREKTSRDRESTVREIESRRLESLRVREFELGSSVIPTVKSERNKESENRVAESVIPNKYRHHSTVLSWHLLVRTKENHEKPSVRIASL